VAPAFARACFSWAAAGVADLASGGVARHRLAVAGHVWPVFHGFRGGKGAATLVGGLALLWPMAWT
jgi:glycerol-3-phosphate acyltransferase PlsY